jgi:hypothetical protein
LDVPPHGRQPAERQFTEGGTKLPPTISQRPREPSTGPLPSPTSTRMSTWSRLPRWSSKPYGMSPAGSACRVRRSPAGAEEVRAVRCTKDPTKAAGRPHSTQPRGRLAAPSSLPAPPVPVGLSRKSRWACAGKAEKKISSPYGLGPSYVMIYMGSSWRGSTRGTVIDRCYAGYARPTCNLLIGVLS